MSKNTNEKQIQTTFVLPRQLRDEVYEFSAKTGAPMGAVMRLALVSYLAQHKQPEVV